MANIQFQMMVYAWILFAKHSNMRINSEEKEYEVPNLLNHIINKKPRLEGVERPARGAERVLAVPSEARGANDGGAPTA